MMVLLSPANRGAEMPSGKGTLLAGPWQGREREKEATQVEKKTADYWE
jgi:hypothetical protein